MGRSPKRNPDNFLHKLGNKQMKKELLAYSSFTIKK